MSGTPIALDTALDLTRTGDIWVFRGSSAADRAIRGITNSPVNHVGMSVVLDDLPALMWHAELGRSLTDHWTGTHQRGAQLHDLGDAVRTWRHRYGQRAWLRQLDRPVTAEREDAVLRCVARLDGTPFPSTVRLMGRWARGRVPRFSTGTEASDRRMTAAYCAEIVAITYREMGLLPGRRRAEWYDPGRFWSGDDLQLLDGYALGAEIPVEVPEPQDGDVAARIRDRSARGRTLGRLLRR